MDNEEAGSPEEANSPIKAINTNKKVFIQELIALCKKHRLRFDENDAGLLSISAIDNEMEYGEDTFIEWLEDAVDYEANEAR